MKLVCDTTDIVVNIKTMKKNNMIEERVKWDIAYMLAEQWAYGWQSHCKGKVDPPWHTSKTLHCLK